MFFIWNTEKTRLFRTLCYYLHTIPADFLNAKRIEVNFCRIPSYSIIKTKRNEVNFCRIPSYSTYSQNETKRSELLSDTLLQYSQNEMKRRELLSDTLLQYSQNQTKRSELLSDTPYIVKRLKKTWVAFILGVTMVKCWKDKGRTITY